MYNVNTRFQTLWLFIFPGIILGKGKFVRFWHRPALRKRSSCELLLPPGTLQHPGSLCSRPSFSLGDGCPAAGCVGWASGAGGAQPDAVERKAGSGLTVPLLWLGKQALSLRGSVSVSPLGSLVVKTTRTWSWASYVLIGISSMTQWYAWVVFLAFNWSECEPWTKRALPSLH